MNTKFSIHMIRMALLTITLILINAQANAQVGRVGINTATPLAMLHVQDSSVIFVGPPTLPLIPGSPPVIGPGTRMMWYPNKAAFRAGRVTGLEWNKDSIGDYSIASGLNTVASKKFSTALGQGCKAWGDNSTAMGRFAIASGSSSISIGQETQATNFAAIAFGFASAAPGFGSVALGYGNTAYGDYATALGYQTFAGGINSIAFGDQTAANGANSMGGGSMSFANADHAIVLGQFLESTSVNAAVFGRYNEVDYTFDPDDWIDTEPLLVLGNGADENNRHNAVTILKNGKVGIGVTSPSALLEVAGNTKLGSNGTPIEEIIKQTIAHNVASIPASGTRIETMMIANADVGSTVYVSPANPLNVGIIIAYARVASLGNVEVTFGNLTASPIDPASMNYYVTVVR